MLHEELYKCRNILTPAVSIHLRTARLPKNRTSIPIPYVMLQFIVVLFRVHRVCNFFPAYLNFCGFYDL